MMLRKPGGKTAFAKRTRKGPHYPLTDLPSPGDPRAVYAETARTLAGNLLASRAAAQVNVGSVAAALGVSVSAVQAWEGGRQVPHLAQIVRYARALGVDPASLLEGL